MANLQPLILTKRFREMIHRLPILDASRLLTENEFRRAYMMLTFMAHAYIWSGYTPADRLPPSICVPLLAVSNYLEVPPVATYASTCLWNHRFVFEDDDSHEIDNLATLYTFTGSLDESWFYLISAAIEAKGGPAICLGLNAIQAAREGHTEAVILCLQGLAASIEQVGALLLRMYENCDPHVFYHQIRPYLAGSKNMADAGLPYGVIYDDYTGHETYRQYGGASAAESSLIQYFDIILGVEHYPTGETPNKSSEAQTAATLKRQHVLAEMRNYMPQSHRRFLEDLEQVSNIRNYVQKLQPPDYRLTAAYDAAITSLRDFRNKHIQLVSRYIIIKSREATREKQYNNALHPTKDGHQAKNIATAATKHSAEKMMGLDRKAEEKGQTGTGGTALMPFLKQSRDETTEMVLDRLATRESVVKSRDIGGLAVGLGTEAVPNTLSAARRVSVSQAEVGKVPGLSRTWGMEDMEGGLCLG